MPRDYRAAENQKRAKARRDLALQRNELREELVPRASAAGATSFPVKVTDPDVGAAVAAFLSRRGDT